MPHVHGKHFGMANILETILHRVWNVGLHVEHGEFLSRHEHYHNQIMTKWMLETS
jgi:hypothetical protein